MFVDDDRSDVRLSATGMIIQRLTMSQEIVIARYGSPVFHFDEIGVGIVNDDICSPVDVFPDLDAPLALQPLTESSPRSMLGPVVEPVIFQADQAKPK